MIAAAPDHNKRWPPCRPGLEPGPIARLCSGPGSGPGRRRYL